MRQSGTRLEDFPLHGDSPAAGVPPLAALETPEALMEAPAAAPLAARWSAAAADAAAVLLIVALAVLGARFQTGESPRLPGIAWAMGFAVYLSLFATVVPLVLFGKTVGMALANLSARSAAGGAGLPAAAALRRWLATSATAATAGLLLLWTASHSEAPTPADRFSGHALTVD